MAVISDSARAEFFEKIKPVKGMIEASLKKEKDMQQAILKIKNKYGKNSIIKGMNLKEGATALERNRQIGGHKA